jgi:hypothetical protein
MYNAIGTPVDSKYIDIEPIAVAMTSTLVIASSREQFYVWQYRTPKSKSSLDISLGRGEARRERVFHIDDTPSGFSDPLAEAGKSMEGAVSSPQHRVIMFYNLCFRIVGLVSFFLTHQAKSSQCPQEQIE